MNLSKELYAINNYLKLHGITDKGIQSAIKFGFLDSRGQSHLEFKEGIEYIRKHFGLFCQYANNSKVQLNNLIKKSQNNPSIKTL